MSLTNGYLVMELNIRIKNLVVDEYVIVLIALLSILIAAILVNSVLTIKTCNVLIRITHLIRI